MRIGSKAMQPKLLALLTATYKSPGAQCSVAPTSITTFWMLCPGPMVKPWDLWIVIAHANSSGNWLLLQACEYLPCPIVHSCVHMRIGTNFGWLGTNGLVHLNWPSPLVQQLVGCHLCQHCYLQGQQPNATKCPCMAPFTTPPSVHMLFLTITWAPAAKYRCLWYLPSLALAAFDVALALLLALCCATLL